MLSSPPQKIVIDLDDYHADKIGVTNTGRQFFITTPFIPEHGINNLGCEYIASYFFDDEGNFIESRIDNLEPRNDIDEEYYQKMYMQHMQALGKVTYCRITIKPFQIEQFNTLFGLIVHPPSKHLDYWWASIAPGNYMAFSEPWDSGYYDT